MTVSHDPTSPHPSAAPAASAASGPSETGATQPIPLSPGVEGVRWPQPPQDAVLQDAPYAAVAPVAAAAPARWSGRRTAAIAALALALTSAGALAAAAASPNGIAGPTEQRGVGVGGPGHRQFGAGGGQQGFGVQPGGGQQGQQPGMGVPGQGRGNH